MQNIGEILKELGIEIPDDKQNDLNKKVAENYKTIAEHEKKLNNAKQESESYKNQLDEANKTLKSFEGVDVDTMKRQLSDYQKKAEDAEKDYKAKIAERDFEDALKTAMEDVKFTSEAAKKAITAEIKGGGLKLIDGKIMGLDDMLNHIKEKDSGAFEESANHPAQFTSNFKPQKQQKTYNSKQEIMKIRDPMERQSAIAHNIDLFRKEE